ncbi:hypothetical protein FRUB_10638 [Fimbriiglobus ruber]|uniref:Uncharacterized protein n=1 Tax=Fimbriiglobus ruber TaxID=1908690 RepID=A0A225DEY7_9BACT|nr:hypothetical protein FRUB_10638 [Fimbriiglobus ruber]
MLAAFVLAIPAVGCGGGSSAPARPLPPGYVAFHRNGQFVPTGNPTLDYWVRVNMIHHFSDRPARPLPDMEHGLAGVIRAADPAGVDPDLVAWAGMVADYLDGRADLDPRTPGAPPTRSRPTRPSSSPWPRPGRTSRTAATPSARA